MRRFNDSFFEKCTFLLTSQLESQRLFFEERLSKLEERSKRDLGELEARSVESERARAHTAAENAKLLESVGVLGKEKSGAEKKCTALSARVTKLQAELDEERELNKCLASNQDVYQRKLAALEESVKRLELDKDKEIEELKAQLRDLMFYLDAQHKMSEMKDVSKEELEQSRLVVNEPPASTSTASASSSSNRRRGNKKS